MPLHQSNKTRKMYKEPPPPKKKMKAHQSTIKSCEHILQKTQNQNTLITFQRERTEPHSASCRSKITKSFISHAIPHICINNNIHTRVSHSPTINPSPQCQQRHSHARSLTMKSEGSQLCSTPCRGECTQSRVSHS